MTHVLRDRPVERLVDLWTLLLSWPLASGALAGLHSSPCEAETPRTIRVTGAPPGRSFLQLADLTCTHVGRFAVDDHGQVVFFTTSLTFLVGPFLLGYDRTSTAERLRTLDDCFRATTSERLLNDYL